MGRHPEVPRSITTLLKRQKGKCTHYGLNFKDGDLKEKDHMISRFNGGTDQYNNLQLLHRHCHDKKTAQNAVGTKRARHKSMPPKPKKVKEVCATSTKLLRSRVRWKSHAQFWRRGRVERLWGERWTSPSLASDADVEIAFAEPMSPLIPFVPVLKDGAEESTVQRALQILRADEQLSQLETVMAFFATFGLDSALVRQIMRWDMAILTESPWYQQILNEGRQQGKREEAVAMIMRQLTRRLGCTFSWVTTASA